MPQATGVANRPNCKISGRAWRRSRRYTSTPEMMSVTAMVKPIWTRSSRGIHREVIWGANVKITKSTPRMAVEMTVSTPATMTLASGNTSRGQ